MYKWTCAGLVRADGTSAECGLLSEPVDSYKARLVLSNVELLQAGIAGDDKVTFQLASFFEGEPQRAIDQRVCVLSQFVHNL